MKENEQYISLNEYCKRFKMGKPQVKYLCEQKKLDYIITPSGYYKIKIGGQTVPMDVHESVVRENAELKSTLRNLQSILNQVLI